MKKTLEDVISKYNAHFFIDIDRRIECKSYPEYTIECLSLDMVQICAYCYIQTMADGSVFFNCFNDFEWKYFKLENDYCFYPAMVSKKYDELKDELDKMKVMVCDDKTVYVSGANDDEKKNLAIYKTCTADIDGRGIIGSGFESDLFFHMNRSKRTKEQLNFLNILICCKEREILLSFLRNMYNTLVKMPSGTEKKTLQESVVKFWEILEKVHAYIHIEEVKEIPSDASSSFSELEKTLKLIFEMNLKKMPQREIRVTRLKMDSFKEILSKFYGQNHWGLDEKSGRGCSCRELFEMIKGIKV